MYILKKKIIYSSIFIVLASFIFIHTSPSRSLRYNLLVLGFPKEAFQSEIVYIFKDDETTKYYFLDPTPVSKATGPTNAWKVKKVGIFYFSSYFGA